MSSYSCVQDIVSGGISWQRYDITLTAGGMIHQRNPSWRTSWALMLHRLTKQNACSHLHSLFSSLPYLCYMLRRSTGACCLQGTHQRATWSHGRCYSTVCCLAASFMDRVIFTSSSPGKPLHSHLSQKRLVSKRVQHM